MLPGFAIKNRSVSSQQPIILVNRIMDSETFRTRLAKLIQKSRKALRLYTSMGRISSGRNAEYTEMQVQEWKEINAELLKQLTSAMENLNHKRLVADVFVLRDRFYTEWRSTESGLHSSHKELIFAAENGDFIKASNLSRSLVALKARGQASQAAHHELQDVINRSNVSQPTIELSTRQVVEEQLDPDLRQAKVIPIDRGRRLGG